LGLAASIKRLRDNLRHDLQIPTPLVSANENELKGISPGLLKTVCSLYTNSVQQGSLKSKSKKDVCFTIYTVSQHLASPQISRPVQKTLIAVMERLRDVGRA
jgi:hypothetical protein